MGSFEDLELTGDGFWTCLDTFSTGCM